MSPITEQSFYDPHALAWTPEIFVTAAPNRLPTKDDKATLAQDVDIKSFFARVVHKVTGKTITSIKNLIKDVLYCHTWETAFGKEFGNIVQDDK